MTSIVDAIIDRQFDIFGLISRSVENLKKSGVANITRGKIQSRLDNFDANWNKFQLQDETVIKSVDKKKGIEYFDSKLYDQCEEAYVDAKGEMLDFLDKLKPQSQSSSNQHGSANRFHRLPTTELPKFNGSYSHWSNFRDLFSSMVTSNHDLSLVEKLHYLKMSVTDEPAQLLKNIIVSNDSFDRAWDILVNRYENKKLLIDSHLSSLLNSRGIKNESSNETKRLIGEIKESLGALEALGCPVDHWDHILVFITVRKLDAESLKEWEKSVGTKKAPSTFLELEEFLIGRIHTLEAIEQMHSIRRYSTPTTSKTSNQFKSHNASISSQSCSICKLDHYISSCPQYLNKSPTQRREVVIYKNLCFNCLGPHLIRHCRTSKRCRTCHKQHHTTLHNAPLSINLKAQAHTSNSSSSTTAMESQTSVQQENSITKPFSSNIASQSHSHLTSSKPVLLATALITAVSQNGEQCIVRALIDQGSEVSFVSESLAQLLRLPRHASDIVICGIGSHSSTVSKGTVNFRFASRIDPTKMYAVNALVLKKLTSYRPSTVSCNNLPLSLRNLPLADPDLSSARKIDVILGADIYCQIIEDGIQRGDSNSLVAQKTSLGWMLSGSFGASSAVESSVYGHQCSVECDLKEIIQRFWKQEEPHSFPYQLSREDQECEDHFIRTVSRSVDGRFIVRLPFKSDIDDFGDSHTSAARMLVSLERRFFRNPDLHLKYSDFMTEYLNLNHMVESMESDVSNSRHFVLPHHGVIRETSSTTKLRVVFNGSQRTSFGFSLNDQLHAGPKLQIDLSDVLIRWRCHRIAFASDIEKMYRQILVHPQDWPLQQILWRNSPNDPIKTFQLCTVTYGLACSPYLALRCLKHLAEEHINDYPMAASIIQSDMYVDDILSGADDVITAQDQVRQINGILKAGGFLAKKWMSNNIDILSELPQEHLATSPTLPFQENDTFRTLGLVWNHSQDSFLFDWKSFSRASSSKFTKRNVLSQIAQMFDPLGWLSPIVITAKIFMQELWVCQLDWDSELPPDLSKKWQNFLTQLEIVPTISVPRWLGISTTTPDMEIHGFSDASMSAYGAVIYLRVRSNHREVRVNLVTSKSKVSPLKRVTIPRLELCAAVLLTRLVKYVQKTLNISDVSIHLWTDSSVVLAWIQSNPSRWKDYVRNRVTEIQDFLPAQWHHVPGKDNPADLVSRGVSPSRLPDERCWWHGPEWLLHPSTRWPSSPISADSDNLEELKIHSSVVNNIGEIWDLVNRFSNLTKLLRVTVWCQRFVEKSKRKRNISYVSDVLSPEEINAALLFWIQQVQRQHLSNEFQLLASQEYLPRSNPLHRLCPFIDGNDFLRLRGRLRFANLDWDEKHPIIIPKQSTLTSLIIDHHHRKTLHGGTQVTLASIRRQFWIVGGRVPVRSFIHRCMVCARQKVVASQQIMGQLPPSRVIPGRPFLNSGVDYAGPFMLRTFRGRGAKTYKSYIIVFICMATSAIHIEIATDYTTSGFIAAYKRFTGRRGICASISSDCGTNFVGADRELRSMFKATSVEWKQLANILSNDGTKWKFNPPAAPHFGGKWEAAVRAIKYHLKRVVGDASLTYEEFSTLVIQIEAVLNSRPLCPISDDPNQIDVLTPAHFLIGSNLSTVPEPSLLDVSSSRLSRWQLLRKMVEQFWNHWTKYYLQYIQNGTKWFEAKNPLQVGALVLLKDERLPPSKWALARITQLHPGPDGNHRVATIKTPSSVLTRPITKLCVLPL